MILKEPGETTIDAIERVGRTFSANPLVTADGGPANITLLYELIGALAAEVKICAIQNKRGGPRMNDLPTAVWSGTIMGIRVHVLSDGRRIIDAEDLTEVFERIGSGDLDPAAFGAAMANFAKRL